MNQRSAKHYLGLALLLAAGYCALLWLDPLDYRYFSAATRAWLNGSSRLYDAGAPQFFYAPWSLLVLVPLAPLPDRFGQAVLNLLSLASVMWSIQTLSKPATLRASILALINPFVASVVLLGQWDGLLLGGAALGWLAVVRRRPWLLSVALLILTTKPTNIVLVVLVLAWAARAWSVREWMRVVALPVLAFIAAFGACGVDWMLRYSQFARSSPPVGYNVSWWQSSATLALGACAVLTLLVLVYRQGAVKEHIALALVVNLMISPFVVPYHYTNTMPMLALLTHRDWRVGIGVWALGLAAFICFVLRLTDAILSCYLVALVGLHIYYLLREKRRR